MQNNGYGRVILGGYTESVVVPLMSFFECPPWEEHVNFAGITTVTFMEVKGSEGDGEWSNAPQISGMQ